VKNEIAKITFYHILAIILLVCVAIYAWFWSDWSHMHWPCEFILFIICNGHQSHMQIKKKII